MSNPKNKNKSRRIMIFALIVALCALIVPVSFAFALPGDSPSTTTETQAQVQTIGQPGIAPISVGAQSNKVTNSIAITGENETYLDPEDSKDDDKVDVTINNRKPKLSISKKADKDTYSVGDKITYTVKVENTGDADALNVIVKDTFSGSGTLDTNDPGLPQGVTWDEAQNQFTIEKVEEGGNVEFSYSYTVLHDDATADNS